MIPTTPISGDAATREGDDAGGDRLCDWSCRPRICALATSGKMSRKRRPGCYIGKSLLGAQDRRAARCISSALAMSKMCQPCADARRCDFELCFAVLKIGARSVIAVECRLAVHIAAPRPLIDTSRETGILPDPADSQTARDHRVVIAVALPVDLGDENPAVIWTCR